MITPARIEELAREAISPNRLSSEETAVVAIRTAVREALDAAAAICDGDPCDVKPEYEWLTYAEAIRRLRDELAPP